MNTRIILLLLLLNPFARFACAADAAPDNNTLDLQAVLAHEIVGPAFVLSEVQDYIEPRVPEMPPLTSAKDWTRLATRLREDVLKRVVLRGEAARWSATPSKVEWRETIPGGPGYHIRKLRYEAVPGFWIPALLYEPDVATAKMPVLLAVNGHDPSGKIAPYKQALCINQAKRGMLALNVEWIGMGQLAKPNYQHGRMNQLDLCGTSGVSPYYLSMKHGLDVLLGLPNADPLRVAVTGHSGGGWQTIFISSLDTRVTLSDPVAGYSGFRVRVRHLKDLGDPEQTPCDLATVADYLHLTAMMAPRALLLTYNANDECCFEAGYVLPTLLAAAQPVYQLFGQESRLRSHINYDPGTHNYERDNREAFYRMEGDNFYAGDASFNAKEIPSDAEFKTREQLDVPLPETNADFNSLALALSQDLPHVKPAPAGGAARRKWQQQQRAKLRAVVKAKDYAVSQTTPASREEKGGVKATYWRFRTGGAWTLPATELSRGQPQGVTLLIADAGRRSTASQVERLLAAGQRVVALDPFYFGEGKPKTHDYLWGLTLATIGDRPLGLQASQVAAVARWLQAEYPGEPLTLSAVGPRTSTVALVAAGLEEQAIAQLDLQDPFPSLKTVLQQNYKYEDMPEMFCFGLLEAFDMAQLKALADPRPVLETARPAIK
ncbi:MAG: hypothetical protein NT167_22645 [Verrucomicrobia bacterium]|nr:hypothetical protein [Verrucomicrobiota bacterium]